MPVNMMDTRKMSMILSLFGVLSVYEFQSSSTALVGRDDLF